MKKLTKGQRQIIAEKVSSTVRVLELLGFDYEVSAPRHKKEKGNKSPRIIRASRGNKYLFTVYNNISGNTWGNLANGKPIPMGSNEDLYTYLRDKYG